MKRYAAFVTCILSFALTLFFLPVPQACGSPVFLKNEEVDCLVKMRVAGLNRDMSAIPAMIEALQRKRVHPLLHITLLHSLAQLGAAQALPVIDEFAIKGDPEAKIAEARLIAEETAHSVASGKISRFYQELGLTSSQINEVVKRPVPKNGFTGGPEPFSLEVLAMREVADMLYHGDYKEYAHLPEVEELDFKLDLPSALKVKLAPLDTKERINMMVNDLAHVTVQTGNTFYEMQLLFDEGLRATSVIADRLREIDTHRDQYSLTGFSTLLEVLVATRDPAQSAFQKHFAADSNPDVVRAVQGGGVRLFKPGY